MTKKSSKYDISIAHSNKKASSVVDSFKVRKSGNSSIVTVPDSVKEALHVEDGDQIQYVTVKDENDESVVVVKKIETDKVHADDEIDDEVVKAYKKTKNKYADILKALAEL
jgi:antitoxin component of MazEF toxin-antitoxin module